MSENALSYLDNLYSLLGKSNGGGWMRRVLVKRVGRGLKENAVGVRVSPEA